MGTVVDPQASAGVRQRALCRSAAYPLVVVAALLLAWLVPLLAQALRADWITPPLLLLGVAALGRAGTSLPDRLMLALALLLGGTCAAGPLLSVWPGHLRPVPVAGTAFTVLILVAVATRRRPSLPIRTRGGDWVVLGCAAAGAASVLWPFRDLSMPDRLGMVATGADYANHLAITDAVRAAGGYAFLHGDAPAVQALYAGLRTYPQGAHLTSGLLLNFLQSGPHRGAVLRELGLFVWFEPASFIFLIVAVLWALRRLAGPAVAPLALLPVAALGTAGLVWHNSVVIMWLGALPETLALAEFAILVALLARPSRRTREQMLLVAALIIAISTTYFLMLPVVALLLALWAWTSRRRLWARRGSVLAVTVPAAALAAVMPVVTLRAASARTRLLGGGAIPAPDWRLILTFVLLALCGAGLRSGLRSPAWRWTWVTVLLAVALCAGVGLFQRAAGGQVGYYFDKAAHIVMVSAVLGLGPVARLLNPVAWPRTGRIGRRAGRSRGDRAGARRSGRSRWVGAVVASAALTTAVAVSFAPVRDALASTRQDQPNYGYLYLHRQLAQPWLGRTIYRVVAALPARADTVTVVWAGRGLPVQATQWVNVLGRHTAVSWPGHNWVWRQPASGTIPSSRIVDFARANQPHQVRFITDNPGLLAEVHAISAAYPDLHLSVALLSLPP